jgi:hypothetical protein
LEGHVNRPAGAPRDGGIHAGKAALVIGVAVLIGVLVLHHKTSPTTASTGSSRAAAAPTTTVAPATTTTTPAIPPSSIKLQVLNGTGSGSLASQWATKLRTSPGYDTLAPDDTTSRVTQSAIYVETPGYLPEAYALATTVGLSPTAVNTTIPAPASAPIPTSERSKANLVLVIGPDLATRA